MTEKQTVMPISMINLAGIIIIYYVHVTVVLAINSDWNDISLY